MTKGLMTESTPELSQEKKETCVHHWVIDPPEGPVSRGVCKKCGAVQEFPNYFPYSKWEGEKTDSEIVSSLLEEWNKGGKNDKGIE